MIDIVDIAIPELSEGPFFAPRIAEIARAKITRRFPIGVMRPQQMNGADKRG